jgi:hypothetical protein
MVDILYLITLIPTLLLSSLRSDDDFFDEVNYKYTVALLVLFSTITATKQFDDDRIECWNRANFGKPYIVDRNQSIPVDIQQR